MKVEHEKFMAQQRVVEAELKKLQDILREENQGDRWQNVTEECEVDGAGWIRHKGVCIVEWHGGLKVGYRLRKVQVVTSEPLGNKCGGQAYQEKWAFLIYHKVSP